MNKTITITITKEVKGFKEPALIAESENTCLRNVENLTTITVGIIIIVTTTETIITGNGIITIVVNGIGTTKITGIIILLHNSSNNNSSLTITIRLTIFRQIT